MATTDRAAKPLLIRSGEIKDVNGHVLSCFNLEWEADEFIRVLTDNAPLALFYADPPWGGPMYAKFGNKAGAGKGSYRNFREQMARIVSSVRDVPIIIEMGLNWVSDWQEALTREGVPLRHLVQGTYAGKRPMIYLIAGPQDSADTLASALKGVDDLDSPGKAILALGLRPGQTVADPCCGNGLTARFALSRGLRFVGNEIGAQRASETYRRLAGVQVSV